MNDKDEIMREIAWAYYQLSPENLTCDGELTTSAVNIKRSRLNAKLINLQAKLGRKVSETEAFKWELAQRS